MADLKLLILILMNLNSMLNKFSVDITPHQNGHDAVNLVTISTQKIFRFQVVYTKECWALEF